MHLFPVRHHSPRTALTLATFLDAVRPKHVLIEGPADAGPEILSVLADPATSPPVAILGYRTDGTPGSVLYPFASYSPEFVALKWAAEHGAAARFIDMTVAQSLAHRDQDLVRDAEDSSVSVNELAAERLGFRSFEEMWEASFEAPSYDPESFSRALIAYAEAINQEERSDRDYHRARDLLMARAIEEVAGDGPVAAVMGASHAAAMAAGDFDLSLAGAFSRSVPAAITVIPYSFPRLAEQLGYGAGNRAPQYYQRAFDRGGDFRTATLEVLIELAERLRVRGFSASLADTIEAYRLANMLATIRGKAAPGLDEVREATIATMCHGDPSHVEGFLWTGVVGRNVGRVASRVGRNSLQEEFWREVEKRKLPRTDSPEGFSLGLGDQVQVETSIFLHRLRLAGVPYATYVGQSIGRRKAEEDDPGGFAALSRRREAWEALWTPATDVALVERIVLGDSLARVAERVLVERLDEAATTGQAADVLMESVVTSTPEALNRALDACERFAASDDDLVSLARACRALSGLSAYGSSREKVAFAQATIEALLLKIFTRAVLRAPAACAGSDEAMAPVKGALRTLHEVALTQPLADKLSWMEAARSISFSYSVNPGCAGLVAGLLYLAQELDDGKVAELVSQRLSNHLEPEHAAGFLEGFLEVNALVLVKSRPVVAALDAFLTSIATERFKDALPVLRRAFSPLGATERRYLLENLLALRKLGEHAREAAQVIGEKDQEKLREMSEEVSRMMDDLGELL